MSNGNNTTWTDERDETLRNAWKNTSATAPEIAKAMGGFDHTADGGKNAIIGRARRLGLTRKGKVKEMTDTQRAALVKAKESVHSRKSYLKKLAAQGKVSPEQNPAPAPEPVAVDANAAPWSFQLPFGELRDFSAKRVNQCRKIDINDIGPNYLYCVSDTPPGRSYCAHCEKICRGETRKIVVMTEAQREERRAQGLRAGYASLRSRGRVMGRSVAAATSPVLDAEARVG